MLCDLRNRNTQSSSCIENTSTIDVYRDALHTLLHSGQSEPLSCKAAGSHKAWRHVPRILAADSGTIVLTNYSVILAAVSEIYHLRRFSRSIASRIPPLNQQIPSRSVGTPGTAPFHHNDFGCFPSRCKLSWQSARLLACRSLRIGATLPADFCSCFITNRHYRRGNCKHSLQVTQVSTFRDSLPAPPLTIAY